MMSWLQTRLLRMALIAALAAGGGEIAVADCTLTSTGMVPVNDLGTGTYKGELGGLYPNGQNNPPPAHLSAGIDIATNQIKPLDASGAVDLANGKIVLISVGMSTTFPEFGHFVPLANSDPAKNPQLVIVNGAQSGKDAPKWTDPQAPPWSTVNSLLAINGVTPAQVQVAWIKEARGSPNSLGAFPVHAQVLRSDLEAIARSLKTNYPNIKIAYFSSRTRAYTNYPLAESPEPFAYESAFSVRWAIEDQLNGAANLNFDPEKGPVVAPWMAWGPYLWADGTNPRSDGFVWLCSDLGGDFTHPSPSGSDKVAHELLAFFKTHPTATPWFLRSTVIGQPPTASATAVPTNGVAPLTVNFSAAASDPGGTIAQFAWTYDDGDFSFAQNPTKSFPAPGSYNVRLTVEDNSGNSVLNVLPITVTTAPTPTPTPSPTPTDTPTPSPSATATPSDTIQVTVQTSLSGPTFTVDSTTYSATQTFSWARGSTHTIATSSPQSGGTGIQYVWADWSDRGAISHNIAPTENTTYIAKFNTNYYLTTSFASAGFGGKVTPGSAWKSSGATISLNATPTNNTLVSYSFGGWTGTGTGSYSGANNPASIIMNGPITETASFVQNPVQVTVQTNIAGPSFTVDGTTYTSAQTFSWQPGSTHTIATTSPQSGGTGIEYGWSKWSDSGAISHVVGPTQNTSYTATFKTQYFLTMNAGTGGRVTPASGWNNSGSTMNITATPSTGFTFSSWTGSGTGSYSGTSRSVSINMNGPITESATFTQNSTPTPTPTPTPTDTPTPTPTMP